MVFCEANTEESRRGLAVLPSDIVGGSSIDVDRTKMTVRSDPIVGGASVKVAERGLHTEPCFLVTLSRSDLSAHTLVSDVCALALHLYLKKEDPIKISVKF